MSEELLKENEALKKQLAQNQQGVEGLLAQLDAHKEHLNESLNTGLNMRTNVIYLKKQNNTLTAQINELKSQLEQANKKLSEITNAPNKECE